MFTVTVILAVIVGGAFLVLGGLKLVGHPMMVEAQTHLGLPPALFKAVGGLEVLGGAGVLVGLHEDLPVIGVLAAVGLVAMTIGAGFYHQKAGDAMKGWLPAVAMGSVAIIFIIFRIGSA